MSSAQKWPSWLPIRDELAELTPYGAPQITDVIQLNTNENPFSLPREVADAIASKISSVVAGLNRYPDRDATALRTKLAGYINARSGTNLALSNIWAANGSNEIIQTLMLACGGAGRTALGFTPSYSVHPLIARTTGTSWESGTRDEDFTLDVGRAINEISRIRPSLVFITTPNNPTGTLTALADIRELAKVCGEIEALLVVDEAYAEFSSELSAVTLINEFPHLVVSRTMSKAFAFAGARLGYLVAAPQLIDAMLVTRLPYHLSALTQAAAEVAVDHAEAMQSEIRLLVAERERVAIALTALGFTPLPSASNFIMFALPTDSESSSHEAWEFYLDRGVLIRDVGLAGYLRVTIGTPDENAKFIRVSEEFVHALATKRGMK